MRNLFTYLKQLGFSEVESKLYLTLLKSGSMSVSELAEATKINRTAAYSHINSLLEKGIIAKVKGSSNKITANPPEHLQYLVEQQITSAMTLKETLPGVIASLNTSFSHKKDAPASEMKYYKGRNGVKVIYEECLKSKIIRSYFNCAEIEKVFPENFELFNDAFNDNAKIKIYEILEDSPESREKMSYWSEYNPYRYFYKFLPSDVKLLANDILIYEGKVAIINVGDKENITGVVLTNEDYYNNSVQLFDLLWRFLPEPEG